MQTLINALQNELESQGISRSQYDIAPVEYSGSSNGRPLRPQYGFEITCTNSDTSGAIEDKLKYLRTAYNVSPITQSKAVGCIAQTVMPSAAKFGYVATSELAMAHALNNNVLSRDHYLHDIPELPVRY